eukprot:SAG11_NODE_4347_length_1938_cov_6.660685_2_plen_129_part_00
MPSLARPQERLGLSKAELKKVVLRLPQVLGYSYEGNTEPTLARLQGRLDLSEAELKKVVLRHPPMLNYSYEGNIEPTLARLQEWLGLACHVLAKQTFRAIACADVARNSFKRIRLYQRPLRACGASAW